MVPSESYGCILETYFLVMYKLSQTEDYRIYIWLSGQFMFNDDGDYAMNSISIDLL